ncbi:MAG: metallophosphoesterase [Anaerolineales bacterium]
MEPGDFRNRRLFPGLEGGPFEIVVTRLEAIEAIPGVVVGLGLAVWAVLISRGDPVRLFTLAGFVIADCLLLLAIHWRRVSFGPVKGPLLGLAVGRGLIAFVPGPVSILVQVVATASVLYAFWLCPQSLGLSREVLVTPKLPGGAVFRVLHFGDLHLERAGPMVDRLVRLIRSVSPDCILISGDYLSYSSIDDPAAWEAVRKFLSQLSAPRGVFVVAGTPAVDRLELLPRLFGGTGVRWLDDESVALEQEGWPIELVGVTCTHKPFEDAPRLARLLNGDPGRFRILLYHTPDLAPDASRLGIDLQLSGHTHGGQIRLPLFGALYTSSLYGKCFEAGRYSLGGMTLYVTRGIGMEGRGAPRIRFLCPPEATLWQISGGPTSPGWASDGTGTIRSSP